jgi:hypothetical protein
MVALLDAHSTKPAFFGIEDNRGLVFLRVRHHHVRGTHVHA